jgi:hypothetical protein
VGEEKKDAREREGGEVWKGRDSIDRSIVDACEFAD